jgi:hypothetical protein
VEKKRTKAKRSQGTSPIEGSAIRRVQRTEGAGSEASQASDLAVFSKFIGLGPAAPPAQRPLVRWENRSVRDSPQSATDALHHLCSLRMVRSPTRPPTAWWCRGGQDVAESEQSWTITLQPAHTALSVPSEAFHPFSSDLVTQRAPLHRPGLTS